MQSVSLYPTLDEVQLSKEFADVMNAIVFTYSELGSLKADQNTSFLSAYIQSPAGNVAGKTKDAEYQVQDVQHEIIQREHELLALLTRKEFLLCLIK